LHHPIHVTGGPDGDVWSTVLHNLQIMDAGQQFVKVNASGRTPDTYADHGVLECSLFELTAAGRPNVASEPGGCYTGGIDGHEARGWRVHKNIFRGIACDNGSLAEHAIHFWSGSRDTMVEDNLIIDCARGIGFGLGDGSNVDSQRAYLDNPYPSVDYVGHYDGNIRNNMIAISSEFAFFDTGIELEQARGTKVLHNTVIHPDTAFASISHRFADTRVVLENNLVRTIRGRDGSEASGTTNVEHAPDDLFVDVADHDLHLRKSAALAIDQGEVVTDSGNDIDGDVRDAAPDIGADEIDP